MAGEHGRGLRWGDCACRSKNSEVSGYNGVSPGTHIKTLVEATDLPKGMMRTVSPVRSDNDAKSLI